MTEPTTCWTASHPRLGGAGSQTELTLVFTAICPGDPSAAAARITSALRRRVAGAVHGHADHARYHDLRGRLQAAERDLARLHVDRSNLDVDRQSALLERTGEDLARQLSALDDRRRALDERLAATERGMDLLRREVQAARSACEQVLR